ncbi:UNVERIFIED_CONTAM: hypothetical protein Sangu_2733000 [Sesamum angustifolium]|uniref:Uncharacterized protein n=1 Tax=Sesamum angustifolium TaxID=2727405 RepID=A0AAW2IX87_9LAMI
MRLCEPPAGQVARSPARCRLDRIRRTACGACFPGLRAVPRVLFGPRPRRALRRRALLYPARAYQPRRLPARGAPGRARPERFFRIRRERIKELALSPTAARASGRSRSRAGLGRSRAPSSQGVGRLARCRLFVVFCQKHPDRGAASGVGPARTSVPIHG